jgi:hypothetical protein
MILPRARGARPAATTGRYYHAASLPNGTVLVAGGYDEYDFLISAQLYDPDAGTWTATGGVGTARRVHTLTHCSTAEVLVAGGYNGTSLLASTQLYDPAAGTWVAGHNVTDITKNWVPDQWLGDGV